MPEARDTATRFVNAFNAHDESAIRSLNAPNTRFDAPGDVRLEGREAATGYAMAWLNAFPDARMIVLHEHASGPVVVQECRFEGTHTAPLVGAAGTIPATGNKVAARCVQIGRYENDQVTETRLYYDQVDLLTQLGVMPAPAVATAR
jgi:predicted ester cyclase